MTLELEIKEMRSRIKKEDQIDIKLLKKVAKFLGPDNNPARDKILIESKEEMRRVKETFLVGMLGKSKEEASKIIRKVTSELKSLKSTYRTIFYYYLIKEITSKNKIRNIHPGEILSEEFLKPLKISAYKLAKDIGVPQTRISMIVKGERSVTADTALRLSKYFGNSSKFWLGLQNDYDIEESEKNNLLELIQIKNCA